MSRTVLNKVTDTIDTPHVQIVYRHADKQISAYDKDDRNNEPACYTTKKRGLDAAWAALEARHAAAGDALTFRDVQTSFRDSGISYHYWCRMD